MFRWTHRDEDILYIVCVNRLPPRMRGLVSLGYICGDLNIQYHIFVDELPARLQLGTH